MQNQCQTHSGSTRSSRAEPWTSHPTHQQAVAKNTAISADTSQGAQQHDPAQKCTAASQHCSSPTSTADWFETTDKQQKLHRTAIPKSLFFFFFRHTESCKDTKSKSFTLASSEQKSRHYAIKTAGEHTQIHMYTHSCVAYIYFFFFSTAAKQLWHDILCHSIWPWMDMAEERDVKCAKAFVMPIVKQKQIF